MVKIQYSTGRSNGGLGYNYKVLETYSSLLKLLWHAQNTFLFTNRTHIFGNKQRYTLYYIILNIFIRIVYTEISQMPQSKTKYSDLKIVYTIYPIL
jgi:hypothetical protein